MERKDNTYSQNTMMDTRPVIIVDEGDALTPEQLESLERTQGETPVISIEHSDKETANANALKPRRLWPWVLGSIIITALIFIAAALGWRYYRTYINIGIPVSHTSEQNIQRLEAPYNGKVQPQVVMTQDSVLGVALNLYELQGLKAEISFTEPDTLDKDVYLYSRCSDQSAYNPKAKGFCYLGTIIENGKEIESDNNRLGYLASANGNVVVGIGRDEEVADYCMENSGNMFRQFILVSAGQLPPKFYLHGKVERRAIGADEQNRLFYIESRHPETMWDFADALREYGFIDAIYITGGNYHSYYRTLDGERHQIGPDYESCKHYHQGRHTIPWMVFKKR